MDHHNWTRPEEIDLAAYDSDRSHHSKREDHSRSRSSSSQHHHHQPAHHHHQSRHHHHHHPLNDDEEALASSSSSYQRSHHYRSRSRSPIDDRHSKVRLPHSYEENGRTAEVPVSRCLGIFGLSKYALEDDIRNVFEPFGPLEKLSLVKNQITGESRGFGFITFVSQTDATRAKERCDGIEIAGRPCRVDYSLTKRAHSPSPGIYLGKKPFRAQRGMGSGGAGGNRFGRENFGRSNYGDSDHHHHHHHHNRRDHFDLDRSSSSSYHNNNNNNNNFANYGSASYHNRNDGYGGSGSRAISPPPPPSYRRGGGGGGSFDDDHLRARSRSRSPLPPQSSYHRGSSGTGSNHYQPSSRRY